MSCQRYLLFGVQVLTNSIQNYSMESQFTLNFSLEEHLASMVHSYDELAQAPSSALT